MIRRLLAMLLTSLAALAVLAVDVDAGQLEKIDGLTVIHLSGSPYEIGYQHGSLLRSEVRESVGQVLRYFRRYLKIPWVRTVLVNAWLDKAWHESMPYVSPEIKEELRGVSEGSGVPLRELYRLHAIPERTYSCSNFAAWGKATAGGSMIHMRNLDWNVQANIQQHPVVFVIHGGAAKHAFVSVAWAGFVGVLTGVNDAGISIGQIGAESVDISLKGEPMAFVMRRVLEEATDAQAAARLITNAHRTVGTNYVVADAKTPLALAIETSHSLARVFYADDPAEHTVSYARPLADAVFRADAAIDPEIRERQEASNGNPRHPGLEDPAGSSAYDVRYLGQAAGIEAHYGRLDAKTAMDIARKVAPPSNVQSVVFAWPDLWVANADNEIPAVQTAYHRLSLKALFSQSAGKQ